MSARWVSFAIGLGLMLAPLALGYGDVRAILRDVGLGLLVCVAALSALERPLARLVLAAPAVALLAAGRGAAQHVVAVPEIVSGALLLVLSAVPSPPLRHGGPSVPDPAGADRDVERETGTMRA